MLRRCLIIAFLAAGCAAHKQESVERTHSTTAPTIQTTQTPRAILYKRTGGIAGTDDRVAIWPDGMVIVRGKLLGDGTMRLSSQEMAKLQSLFANFGNLKKEYLGGAPDAYEIVITYGGKSVAASDLAPALPEDFRRIFAAIEAIAAQAAATTPAPQ